MHKYITNFRVWGMILVFLLFIFSACEKTDPTAPEEGTPPDIPPASTFQMDFSDFQTQGTGKIKHDGQEILLSKQNWGWAAANVFVWNVILTINLIVPVAAFLESFNHEPVQQADGSWLWMYNFTVAGFQHTAKLTATTEDGFINWKMQISKQNNFTDFEWFTGRSNLVATEGTWTLNAKPNDPTPLLGILWHRNPLDGSSDIRYTNIIPNNDENGAFIQMAIVPDSALDASYQIYSVVKNNMTDIEWSRTTKEGRISDSLHFVDNGQWHCWNNLYDDIECQ
ncbi:MAG: hypothetical protein DWQ10_08180 [Calditrichaeota bacterium]|nr:MAG: hypothetical protein DWQ10_08180 [Calditrichota bacterium]